MNLRVVGLVVLVVAVVAIAIYLALRPSQAAATTLFGSSSSSSSRAGQAISSIGGTGVAFASSIANAAG